MLWNVDRAWSQGNWWPERARRHGSGWCAPRSRPCSRPRGSRSRRRPVRRARRRRAPTRSSSRTARPAARAASGTSRAPATRASRASRPTSASTTGETVSFKISTPAHELPHRHLPHGLLRRQRRAQGRDDHAVGQPAAEPARLPDDTTTGLIDCGNWAVSASWAVPADRGLGHLLRQPRARRRHRRGEPHRLRRPRRRRPLGRLLPDLRHHLAGLQRTTAATACTSAARVGRGAAPTRSATTGPFITRAVSSGRGLGLQRRVPDGPLAGAQRLRRQLLPPASTPIATASLIRNHKVFMSVGHDEYWSGAAARERRGRARRGRQPRLLQRQRGVLEDALGDQHRRLEHAVPHARLLQGDPRERSRSTRSADLDRHVARPARSARRGRPSPRTR